MAVNKVEYGNTTIIDITDTTAVASDVAQGKYFYNAAGVKTEGTASGGGDVVQDEDGYVVLDDDGQGLGVVPFTVSQNGIYNAPSGFAYNPVTVNVEGGGGGSLADQVRFFDYDGTLLHSYSKSDFNALSAMPSNPSHTGLVAQGWNWSLSEAKAYLTSYPNGILNIGQMYTTDDGKTRLYIHIDDDTPSNRLTFYVRFTSSASNNTSIDWGDGVVETKGAASGATYSHTYATVGDYVIKLTVNTGTISFVGSSGSNGASIYGSRANGYSYNRGRIKKAEIGENVTSIGNYAFTSCYSLTGITIPSGVKILENAFQTCYSLTGITIPSDITSFSQYTFSACYSLKSVAISSDVTTISSYPFQYCYSLADITLPSVTNISSYAFSGCYSIKRVTIPSSVTSIGNYAFQNCYSFTNITIPSSVTSIGNYAFSNCYGMSEYHFKPTTPPTLANTNAFNGIQSDCKIYVPYSEDHSILEAYKAATNWSTYASYMVEESA